MISVILCTYNRQELLKQSITAIQKNTQLPDEIIIVEQGDVENTKEVLKNMDVEIYFFSEKSAAQARNFGLKKAQGEIVCFIDDDVIISENYIETAYKFLAEHTEVQIVCGKDMQAEILHQNFFKKLIRVLLYQDVWTPKRTVLRSGQNTVYINFEQATVSQWASGLMVIRKAITQGIHFRETFKRWSFGEDVDFSYQVYKKYGEGSIYFLPNLLFSHIKSQTNRIGKSMTIRMVFIYRYIFWKQEVYNGKILNLFLYAYSEVFRAILYSKMYENRWESYKEILKTQWYILRNYKKIDQNTVDYNAYIFDE